MQIEKNKTIVIIEDEFSIALDMEMRLQNLGYTIAGIANSYKNALPLLIENDIDIVLMDINLGDEKNGIEIAKIIQSKFNVPIIFVSAYTDEKTVSEALETNPVGFISKPFKDVDLNNAIQIALQKHQININSNNEIKTDNEIVFIKDKGVYKQIKINEIFWIEAMDNYSLIHTQSSQYIVNSFLKDVLTKLGSGFLRIHRSHAVAINKITAVEDNVVYIGKTYLTISQNYKNDLINKLNVL